MTGRIRRLRSSSGLGVGVVALVSQQSLWAAAWMAGASGDGRDAVDQVESLGTSLTFAAVVITLSGVPRPSQIQVVFAAGLPPVDRRRAGVGYPFFARM